MRNHHARIPELVSRVLQNNGIDVYVLKDSSATIVKQVSLKIKYNLVLSTELLMLIVHLKELLKLTSRAFAIRQSE